MFEWYWRIFSHPPFLIHNWARRKQARHAYTDQHFWYILDAHGAHPNHPTLMQALMQALMLSDKALRLDYSNFILNTMEENLLFLWDTLWGANIYTGWHSELMKCALVVFRKSQDRPHFSTPITLVNESVVWYMGNPNCWTNLLRWDISGWSLPAPVVKHGTWLTCRAAFVWFQHDGIPST